MKANCVCVDCCEVKAIGYIEDPAFPADKRSEAKEKLAEIVKLGETMSAPEVMAEMLQMVGQYRDTRELFGEIKTIYNEMLLSIEEEVVNEIRNDEDPLVAGIQYAITGNYIDAIAVDDVQESKLRELLDARKKIQFNQEEIERLRSELSDAKKLLYIADNAGEIVFDKFFIRVLKELYPNLQIAVMVRGEFVLNDATKEDAELIGLDKVTEVISNGTYVPGTSLERISGYPKEWIETADLCIAKGQGNFETLRGSGINVYYLFLCKCHMFVDQFKVEPFTPMLVNERRTDFALK